MSYTRDKATSTICATSLIFRRIVLIDSNYSTRNNTAVTSKITYGNQLGVIYQWILPHI